MIFYSEKNVYEAAKERINRIFDKHTDVPIIVSFSGGKDSTVVLNLTHEVMRERGIQKIPVFWLDQEIESPFVVDYMRRVRDLPWVDLYWVQSEYPKYNAHIGKWESAWPKGGQWLRDKEPNNPYVDFDTSDYKNYSSEYNFFLNKIFGEYVTIGGLHIDESPTRRMSLLKKAETMCPFTQDKIGGGVYYPLFDWRVYDIWYYIFSNKLDYCKQYNYMFSSTNLIQCRVGSFWNEQSHKGLNKMKSICPMWYDKVCKRVKGVNTTYHSYEFLTEFVNNLPPYFSSWKEYVFYLIDNITAEEFHAKMKKKYLTVLGNSLSKCKGYKDLEDIVDATLGRSVAICAIKEDHNLNKISHTHYSLEKLIKSKLDERKG